MTKGKANFLGDLSSLRMITYNLDGLNPHNLMKRTVLQLKTIMNYKPLLINFQEVIPETAVLIYDCLVGLNSIESSSASNTSGAYICSDHPDDWMSGKLGPYFTLTFVKKELKPVCFFERIPYNRLFLKSNEQNIYGFKHEYTTINSNSYQYRDLLVTKFLIRELINKKNDEAELEWRWGLIPFINCHLESTGTCLKSTESFKRMAQLLEGLEYLKKSRDFTVEIQNRIKEIETIKNQTTKNNNNLYSCGILSGDLNIRNEEAQHVLKRLEEQEEEIEEENNEENIEDREKNDKFFIDIAEKLETPQRIKKKNSNLEELKYNSTWFMPGKLYVNARYDRIYLYSYKNLLNCERYEIFGDENYFNHGPYYTLSDHRGILVDFVLNNCGIPMVRLQEKNNLLSSTFGTFSSSVSSSYPSSSSTSLSQSSKKTINETIEIEKEKIEITEESTKDKRRRLFLEAYEKRENNNKKKLDNTENEKLKDIEIIEIE